MNLQLAVRGRFPLPRRDQPLTPGTQLFAGCWIAHTEYSPGAGEIRGELISFVLTTLAHDHSPTKLDWPQVMINQVTLALIIVLSLHLIPIFTHNWHWSRRQSCWQWHSTGRLKSADTLITTFPMWRLKTPRCSISDDYATLAGPNPIVERSRALNAGIVSSSKDAYTTHRARTRQDNLLSALSCLVTTITVRGRSMAD